MNAVHGRTANACHSAIKVRISENVARVSERSIVRDRPAVALRQIRETSCGPSEALQRMANSAVTRRAALLTIMLRGPVCRQRSPKTNGEAAVLSGFVSENAVRGRLGRY